MVSLRAFSPDCAIFHASLTAHPSRITTSSSNTPSSSAFTPAEHLQLGGGDVGL